MFELLVSGHFDAAHYLRGYGGKCESLHGHRFYVTLAVRGQSLNETGILYDFARLKEKLKEVLNLLDHTCLNDLTPFGEINPSVENLSQFIYGELTKRLADVSLSFVEVAESPESRARYYPDKG